MAHGGIAMALLDEAMAHAAMNAGYHAVTASMSTRFRKAVPLQQPLIVSGAVAWMRRHVLSITAQIRDRHRMLLAEAQGSFIAKSDDTPATP